MTDQTAPEPTPDLAIDLLRHVMVSLVRRDGIALTTQQFGVFLACYLCPEADSLRGLVQELDLPRMVVLRAVDKLTELGLITCAADPRDSRNQFMRQTDRGLAMLQDLRSMTEEVNQPGIQAG